MKKELVEVVLGSISLEKLANGVIDEVLEPALKAVVLKSENKFDDMIMMSLYPLLEKEIKTLIAEQVLKLETKLKEATAPKLDPIVVS